MYGPGRNGNRAAANPVCATSCAAVASMDFCHLFVRGDDSCVNPRAAGCCKGTTTTACAGGRLSVVPPKYADATGDAAPDRDDNAGLRTQTLGQKQTRTSQGAGRSGRSGLTAQRGVLEEEEKEAASPCFLAQVVSSTASSSVSRSPLALRMPPRLPSGSSASSAGRLLARHAPGLSATAAAPRHRTCKRVRPPPRP